jgi:hypothetical protein
MRRQSFVLPLALTALATLVGGCSAATTDPGLDAMLRLSGAQFYRGKPPTPADGPAVQQLITIPASTIRRGLNNSVQGFVTRETTAIALYLDGDVGYWIVEPGMVDATQGGQLSFSASAAYAQNLPAGNYTLKAMAVGAGGHFGPITDFALQTEDVMSSDTLLVSLAWDTQADLDLHLVTPDGTEVWANKINSTPPPVPGSNGDPDAWKSGGILDFDSNSGCVIDGRRMENVFWTVAPPKGHYLVRVDTWSLCGEAMANWRVTATLGTQNLGMSSGWSRPSDAEMVHGLGAGVKALEFDVP